MIAAAIIVAAGLIVAGVIAPVAIQGSAWRRVQARNVTLTLTTGTLISGVLLARRGDILEVADAHVHTPTGSSRMDGNAYIERDRIEFMQVMP